jgi:hypothetical protein
MLQRGGYEIKVLNTIDFKKSMHYNPFTYIRSEKDILKFVTALIANTKGEGKSGDDFWVKAETLLYCALVGAIHFEAPESQQNMNTLVELINSMETKEDDENFKNAVDYYFEELELGNEEEGLQPKPDCFAVRQYKKYKLAAGVICSNGLLNRSPLFNAVGTLAAQADGHANTAYSRKRSTLWNNLNTSKLAIICYRTSSSPNVKANTRQSDGMEQCAGRS